MYLWLLISLTCFGALFTAALIFTLRFHLLLRETCNHRELFQLLGEPSGIEDYSLLHNAKCYQAINKYFLEQGYLELTDSKLRQRFISHQQWKQNGKILALLVVLNMAACILAIVIE